MSTKTPYQPKTGQPCHCRRGVVRDNCPDCEGTGQRIDFAAIRAKSKEVDNARDQAAAQLDSIREMVKDINGSTDDTKHDEAVQAVYEDALSVEVRSAWYAPGEKPSDIDGEYKILLCWGGPACRIVGDLADGQPENARLEYQDWGTPWTEYRVSGEDEEVLLTYARCFSYGE